METGRGSARLPDLLNGSKLAGIRVPTGDMALSRDILRAR